MRLYILLTLLFMLILGETLGQNAFSPTYSCCRPVTTAVRFLMFNENAQSAAMGGIGVVAARQYAQSGLTQNPSLLARKDKLAGGFVAYVPVMDGANFTKTHLQEIGQYAKIDDNNAFGVNFRRYRYGKMTLVDQYDQTKTYYPSEYYASVKYARTVSPKFSIGAGYKYVYSDIATGFRFNGISIKAGSTFAFDLGFDYRERFRVADDLMLRWDNGLSLLNLGPKISYTNLNEGGFLPAMLKVGSMLTLEVKDVQDLDLEFDLAYQVDKLLAPTPSPVDTDENYVLDYKERSVLEGMITSFYDAPEGMMEELTEFMHAFGMEARLLHHNDFLFAIRSGAILDHPNKGSRKWITYGLGVGVKGFRLDLAGVTQKNSTLWKNEHTPAITLSYKVILANRKPIASLN